MIRTVILADVGRIADDAIEFCPPKAWHWPVHSRPVPRGDVVVDSGQLEASGVRLGMVEKVVLKSAEAELALGRLSRPGPTFALYRGPPS